MATNISKVKYCTYLATILYRYSILVQLGITQSAVECLTQLYKNVDINMHADDKAQLQKIPRNFYRLYVQMIIRNACLVVLLHRNLHCSSRSSLLAAIA